MLRLRGSCYKRFARVGAQDCISKAKQCYLQASELALKEQECPTWLRLDVTHGLAEVYGELMGNREEACRINQAVLDEIA